LPASSGLSFTGLICERRLEKILDQDYGIHIPHNRIHKILLKNNMAKENEKKIRQRKKWIRYERKHSLSLLHLD
jgi:putative transposase